MSSTRPAGASQAPDRVGSSPGAHASLGPPPLPQLFMQRVGAQQLSFSLNQVFDALTAIAADNSRADTHPLGSQTLFGLHPSFIIYDRLELKSIRAACGNPWSLLPWDHLGPQGSGFTASAAGLPPPTWSPYWSGDELMDGSPAGSRERAARPGGAGWVTLDLAWSSRCQGRPVLDHPGGQWGKLPSRACQG